MKPVQGDTALHCAESWAGSCTEALASIYASLGKINESMDQWKSALALNTTILFQHWWVMGYFLPKLTLALKPSITLDRRINWTQGLPTLSTDMRAYLCGDLAEARRTALQGGDYYKNNAGFEQMRKIILG